MHIYVLQYQYVLLINTSEVVDLLCIFPSGVAIAVKV